MRGRNPFRGLRTRSARKTCTIIHKSGAAGTRCHASPECEVCGAPLPSSTPRRYPSCGALACSSCQDGRARRGVLRDERGAVVSVFLAAFGLLLLALLAVAADFGRMRLHRQELQDAADAAALSGAVGGALVRVDARGRVYSVRLDPAAAKQAALEAFWLNTGASRAERLMGTIQADAWVDPGDPTAVVVSVSAAGETPFAGLFGHKSQGVTLTARAKGVPR